jgi:hypothetical protein
VESLNEEELLALGSNMMLEKFLAFIYFFEEFISRRSQCGNGEVFRRKKSINESL